MLSKFTVKNFKNFTDNITIDLCASSYEFNKQFIKNNLVNNGIIYGANASGKSNFSFAIFDIVRHLTGFNAGSNFYENYSNKLNNSLIVEFKYCFVFDDDTVEYEYTKGEDSELIDELLKINGKIFLYIKRSGDKSVAISFKGAENLKTDILSSNISIVNYLIKNSILEENNDSRVFYDFYDFIQNMLFFRSLNQNSYIGLESGRKNIAEDIINKNNVNDLQLFLNRAKIDCVLTTKDNKIFFDYGNDEFAYFYEVASSGTRALTLVYYWLQRIKNNKIKFLCIDEFDAFYHHELSEFIVKELSNIDAQVILTTHNTSIMSNDLLRPDCYYVLKDNKITQISKLTKKELRKAHNLEKLYIGGKFSE